jgi:hypothetical protein
VLPAPLVTTTPTHSLALTPTPSRCHWAPASSRPTCQPLPRVVAPHMSAAAPRHRAPVVSRCPASHVPAASPAHTRPPCPRDVGRPPLSERPGGAAPVSCRLTRRHTPAPPSPLLSCPHVAPSRTPCPFPPHRAAEPP